MSSTQDPTYTALETQDNFWYSPPANQFAEEALTDKPREQNMPHASSHLDDFFEGPHPALMSCQLL